MRKGYSVYSPPFRPDIGGIRVMYGLMGWLLAKGEIAFINAEFEDNLNCVAVYPEIIHGNPLNAGTVVRYILNKPGVMASHGVPGPMSFDYSDKIYVFSRIYDTFGVDDDHILFLPIINLNLFKDNNVQRTRTAYYIGKGFNVELHPKDAVLIDKSIVQDQQGLADLLNRCKVLHTYENPTALVEIARLCGCPVVFHPEGAMTKFTKEELETKYEPGMYGVGWGEQVELKSEVFKEQYLDLINKFQVNLDKFICDTQ